MSLAWRARVARRKKELIERLSLSEADYEFYEDNIYSFCRESDEQVRLVFGEECDVDAEIEKMDDWDFDSQVEEIFKKIYKELKHKTGQKEAVEEEEESEEESEDDSETDSDSDSQEVEVEEPIEVEQK